MDIMIAWHGTLEAEQDEVPEAEQESRENIWYLDNPPV